MHKFFSITVSLLLAVSMQAQQPNVSRQQAMQRIEQQVQLYAATFALNEEQTLQFSALYKAYNKKMRAIHDRYRREPTPAKSTLTDEQIEQRILDNFAQSRAILDTREQYYKEFREFLTPSQINQIFEDEKSRRAKMKK